MTAEATTPVHRKLRLSLVIMPDAPPCAAPSSLANRFARVSDATLKYTMAEVEAMSLQEHGQLTVTFGTKVRGRRFEEVLETDPAWVKWCLEHLSESTKHAHKVFLRYVERVVEQAEAIETELIVPPFGPQPQERPRTKNWTQEPSCSSSESSSRCRGRSLGHDQRIQRGSSGRSEHPDRAHEPHGKHDAADRPASECCDEPPERLLREVEACRAELCALISSGACKPGTLKVEGIEPAAKELLENKGDVSECKGATS